MGFIAVPIKFLYSQLKSLEGIGAAGGMRSPDGPLSPPTRSTTPRPRTQPHRRFPPHRRDSHPARTRPHRRVHPRPLQRLQYRLAPRSLRPVLAASRQRPAHPSNLGQRPPHPHPPRLRLQTKAHLPIGTTDPTAPSGLSLSHPARSPTNSSDGSAHKTRRS